MCIIANPPLFKALLDSNKISFNLTKTFIDSGLEPFTLICNYCQNPWNSPVPKTGYRDLQIPQKTDILFYCGCYDHHSLWWKQSVI